jgi:NADH dehydrogenase FAD-containing subunit
MAKVGDQAGGEIFDVVVIGGGISALHSVEECVKKKLKVLGAFGNAFLEFPMGACIFLNDPTKHLKYLCGNPDSWKIKGASYVFDNVAKVDPKQKTVSFDKNPTVQYKTLIVATGSKMPLIMPKPGDTVQQRIDEVQRAGQALAAAKTVVLNGAGAVGVELAGDIRARNKAARIVLLSREGNVFSFAPAAWQTKVKDQLTKMNIEVIKGQVGSDFMEPKLEPGKVVISSGDVSELAYDVFLPTFAQGPNTQFLEGTTALDDRRRIVANDKLQCEAHPEIFGVNVTTQPLVGHPVSSRVTAQAKTCVKNAALFLEGKPTQTHVDKESPPPLKDENGLLVPMTVKFGHGPGAYMMWNTDALPMPLKCCCCIPCGGGFPCCPPPCCWCCGKGCAGCLGNCCGPVESESAAIFMESFMLPKFLPGHGYKGVGQLPPEMQKMQ